MAALQEAEDVIRRGRNHPSYSLYHARRQLSSPDRVEVAFLQDMHNFICSHSGHKDNYSGDDGRDAKDELLSWLDFCAMRPESRKVIYVAIACCVPKPLLNTSPGKPGFLSTGHNSGPTCFCLSIEYTYTAYLFGPFPMSPVDRGHFRRW